MNKCNSLVKYIRFAKASYIRAEENDTVIKIVRKYFNNMPSESYIDGLIKSGCIYYREPSIECKTTPPNPYRIFNNNLISKDSILKLFLYPRPYSIEHVLKIDPAKYIVYENQYFMVVDKPHGLDVGPILDNYYGNITTIIKCYIEKRDGREYKLYNPHRIDSPTRGLIIIIKDQDYLKKFNRIMINNQVSKIYKVFLPKYSNNNRIIKEGIYKHYMCPDEVLPKVLVNEKIEKYHECILEVLKIEEKEVIVPVDLDEVSLDLLQLPISYRDVGKGDYRKQMKSIQFNVVDVKLITGRTHQIRAQFSKMGFPIFGDILYGGKDISDYDIQINNDSKIINNRKQNQNLGKMIGLVSNQLSFNCPITGFNHSFILKQNNYYVNKLNKIK